VLFDSEYFKNKSSICHEVLTEVDHVLPHLKGKTVLDVACGTGRHGYLLEYYGFKVTYLDISPAALEKIHWAHWTNKILGNFVEKQFEHAKFDNVISFHFIEHLTDDQLIRALENMKKAARYRVINVTPHPKHSLFNQDPTHHYRPYRKLVELYLSVLPDTEIYRYDNKHRAHPIAWIRGLFEKLRPHYFENLMFVSEVEG